MTKSKGYYSKGYYIDRPNIKRRANMKANEVYLADALPELEGMITDVADGFDWKELSMDKIVVKHFVKRVSKNYNEYSYYSKYLFSCVHFINEDNPR